MSFTDNFYINSFSLSIIFALLIFIIALSSIIINNKCTIESNQTFAKVFVGISTIFSAIIIWHAKNKFKNPNIVQPVITQQQKPIIIQNKEARIIKEYKLSKDDAQPQNEEAHDEKRSELVTDVKSSEIIKREAKNVTQNIIDTANENIKIREDITKKINNIYNNSTKLLDLLKNIQNSIKTLKLDKSIISTINNTILKNLIEKTLPSFNINIKLWYKNSNTVRTQLSQDLNKNNLNDIYKKLDEINNYFENPIFKTENDLIDKLKDENYSQEQITQPISTYSFYLNYIYYKITNTQGVLK